MRWPRALIVAMNEPGVTCGGPGSGARLDALGSQGATAVLAVGEADARGAAADAAVPPAATAAAVSAASASAAARRRGRVTAGRVPPGWGRKRFIPLASLVSDTRPGGGPAPRRRRPP